MNLSLIANITDIPAVHSLIESEKQAEWLNKNSPLFEAQKRANDLMDNNKARIPMVIEYLESKENRVSVPMYINPNRLSMSNQKLKGKAVTRGGIFYHHWGDDHWQLQLSGTVGFAGMEGIKKLEKIYGLSGVLLQYGGSSNMPVYVDGTTDFLGAIKEGNFTSAVNLLSKGGIKSLAGQFFNQAKAGALSAITGKPQGNSTLRSSNVYKKVNAYLGESVKNVNNAIKNFTTINTGTSVIGQIGGALLGNMIMNRAGLASEPDRQVVDFNQAQQGWADINDELEDPWRPRQIWIYFEDRVYIGHFDSFSYNRVAETPLINYDMRFTVIRQVIVTSYNPVKPEFQPAQAITIPAVFSAAAAAQAFSGAAPRTPSARLVEFAAGTPAAINSAKLEILKTKEIYRLETLIAENNNTTMTTQRSEQLQDWLRQIRRTINVRDDDDVYGARTITDQQRIDYYALGNSNNSNGVNDDAVAASIAELNRIKAYISKLKAERQLTDVIKLSLWEWINKIHVARGTTDNFAAWELDIRPV